MRPAWGRHGMCNRLLVTPAFPNHSTANADRSLEGRRTDSTPPPKKRTRLSALLSTYAAYPRMQHRPVCGRKDWRSSLPCAYFQKVSLGALGFFFTTDGSHFCVANNSVHVYNCTVSWSSPSSLALTWPQMPTPALEPRHMPGSTLDRFLSHTPFLS